MDSVATIAEKAAKGSPAAFSQLVFKYNHAIFRLAFRMCGNLEEAGEISQETFTRAWEAIGRYDPGRPFSSWLYTICLNLVRDHLRRRRKTRDFFTLRFRAMSSFGDPSPDPEVQFIVAETERILQTALSRLKIALREAVLLRYMEELSFAEVGAVLGISVSAAKMRVYRGMESLRKELKNLHFDVER
ncbi:MAG: RNA polymerase sigma factor [Thermodesulfobacteriota bacterium]